MISKNYNFQKTAGNMMNSYLFRVNEIILK